MGKVNHDPSPPLTGEAIMHNALMTPAAPADTMSIMRRLALIPLLAFPLLAGCQAVSLAASKLPPKIVEPAYADLAGRSVAVVVWADPTVDLDYPALTRQIGQRVEKNLKSARDDGGSGARKALEEATFPYPAESYVGYFKKNPTLSAIPADELAPAFGAERVVYVEIDRFTVRGGTAPGLVRGAAELSLAVYEVDAPTVAVAAEASPEQRLPADARARRALDEGAIAVFYPDNGPIEGSNTLAPEEAYGGLVNAIAAEVARRFIPTQADR